MLKKASNNICFYYRDFRKENVHNRDYIIFHYIFTFIFVKRLIIKRLINIERLSYLISIHCSCNVLHVHKDLLA